MALVTLPNNLVDGTIADAVPVMANFNALLFGVNSVSSAQLAAGAVLGSLSARSITATYLATANNLSQVRVFSVDDAGGDPSGLTSSLAAINAQIAAANAAGGIVDFGPGSYLIDGATLSVGGNVYLRGRGSGATQINCSVLTQSIFTFTGANCGVSELKLSYSSPATTAQALAFNSASYVSVTRVFVANAYNGISFNGASYVVASNVVVSSTAATNDGILITGTNAHDFHFTDCTVIVPGASLGGGSGTFALGYGFHIVNAYNVFLSSCAANGFYANLEIAPASSAQAVNNVYASNCSFDLAVANCVAIIPGGSGNAYNLAFVNCSTNASLAGDGLLVNGTTAGFVDTISVLSHRAANNLGNGIGMNAATNVTLASPILAANRGSAGGLYLTNCTGLTLVGGKSGNTNAYPAGTYTQQSNGIFLDSGNSNMTFVGIDCTGNTSTALAGSPGATISFTKCPGINPGGSLTQLQAIGISSTIVTTTTYTNVSGFDFTLYLLGGTCTQVVVDGVTIPYAGGSSNNGSFFVPAGATFSIVFSSIPTTIKFAAN